MVAFDPRGLVFAIGVDSKVIQMYDPASFDKVKFFFLFFLRMHPTITAFLGTLDNIHDR